MINRLPYSHGLPYNPRCQGLVEWMNQTLKKKIGKKMRQAGFQAGEDVDWDWEDLMKEAVLDINRSEIPLYGTSPSSCGLVAHLKPWTTRDCLRLR